MDYTNISSDLGNKSVILIPFILIWFDIISHSLSLFYKNVWFIAKIYLFLITTIYIEIWANYIIQLAIPMTTMGVIVSLLVFSILLGGAFGRSFSQQPILTLKVMFSLFSIVLLVLRVGKRLVEN